LLYNVLVGKNRGKRGLGIVNFFALMQYQGKEEAICPLLPLKRPGLGL